MILCNITRINGTKLQIKYLNKILPNPMFSQVVPWKREVLHPYHSQNIVTKEPKKNQENPFDYMRNQLEEICKKYRSKVSFLNDNEVWVIKKLPYDEIFSLPDVNFSKHAVLCFEQEELAQDMRSVIINLNPSTVYVIEPAPLSYILDVCENTKKGLIIFRRDIDNKIVCRRFI